MIGKRVHVQESLPIPQQIGGNSVANQQLVVSALGSENAEISSIKSRTDKALWTEPFSWPLSFDAAHPFVVTDPYWLRSRRQRRGGHHPQRHRFPGTPRATPVYAINRGVVRQATYYSIYGNAVIIDHGAGVLSMYMHLSDIDVSPGELIAQGHLIGHSGETGYSEGPHLHLSIRVGGVSIDPIKFFAPVRGEVNSLQGEGKLGIKQTERRCAMGTTLAPLTNEKNYELKLDYTTAEVGATLDKLKVPWRTWKGSPDGSSHRGFGEILNEDQLYFPSLRAGGVIRCECSSCM